MRIACVGDVAIDRYVNKGLEKPGGICFNFASNAIEYGADCSIVSVIGNDESARKIKDLISKLGIDGSHLKELDCQTAEQKIQIHENGERKFAGYDGDIFTKWKLTQDDLKFIIGHDAVFVPLSDGLEYVFEIITTLPNDVIKIVDFSQDYESAEFDSFESLIRKYSIFFDIIFIGGTENLIRPIKELSRLYPSKLFVLTLGSNGSMAFYKEKEIIQHSIPIEKITDTTGCGDAFQAAFTVTYLQSHDIKKSLEAGTKQAAKIITHLGSTEFLL